MVQKKKQLSTQERKQVKSKKKIQKPFFHSLFKFIDKHTFLIFGVLIIIMVIVYAVYISKFEKITEDTTVTPTILPIEPPTEPPTDPPTDPDTLSPDTTQDSTETIYRYKLIMLILLSVATVTFLISVLVKRDNQVTALADMPIFYLPKLVIVLLLIPIGVSASDVQLYKMYFIWSIILVSLTLVWMGVLYNMPEKANGPQKSGEKANGPQKLGREVTSRNDEVTNTNQRNNQRGTSTVASDAKNATTLYSMLFGNMIYPFRTTRSKATTTSDNSDIQYTKSQNNKDYLNNVKIQNSNNQGNQSNTTDSQTQNSMVGNA